MLRAIELLMAPDADHALVYALVHDPEFRLATAVLTTAASSTRHVTNPNGHPNGDAPATHQQVQVLRALLQVFDDREDHLRRFLSQLMVREMVGTFNWNELFRANSSTTAIIREYTSELCQEFLQHAFQGVLAELWDSDESCEVNPHMLQPNDDIAANQKRLESVATRIFDRLFDAATVFPYQIARLYRVLEIEMTRLIQLDQRRSIPSITRFGSSLLEEHQVSSRFSEERKSSASLPRLSSVSEDLSSDDMNQSQRGSICSNGGSSVATSSGLSAAKEEFYIHLGGLLFLRFICPALIMPHKMQLTPNGAKPSKALQRTLVLVAKLFQSLANNVEYGSREQYMKPFNAFLLRNRPRLFKFYETICQQAQSDNRRESQILRANFTPRISQLWAPPPSTTNLTLRNSGDATSSFGLVDNQALVTSIEEALIVLRQWMGPHVTALAKQVSSLGRTRSKVMSGVDRMSHSSSSSSGSPALEEIKKEERKRVHPKRKLKSSKALAPIPTTGEDDGDESSTESGGNDDTPINSAEEEAVSLQGAEQHDGPHDAS
ncbi:hypothetical protein PINS_up011973 [Pythium insidiosum]|nr:hypothetical protein PINS_up011973 [Pythium insidiosum]